MLSAALFCAAVMCMVQTFRTVVLIVKDLRDWGDPRNKRNQ